MLYCVVLQCIVLYCEGVLCCVVLRYIEPEPEVAFALCAVVVILARPSLRMKNLAPLTPSRTTVTPSPMTNDDHA